MKIILASQSPRRREILSMITHKFEVIVSNVDETIDKELTNEEQVKHLAYIKAKAVFDETKEQGNRIVIGSDTIVVKDGKIYGKPKDYEDAMQMLTSLKNTKHEVMTGLCIIIEKEGEIQEYLDVDITSVYINNITEKELEDWIATNEAYDKAGGYAIQGKFGVFIQKIEGNYFTVVGLPIHMVYEKIKEYLEE